MTQPPIAEEPGYVEPWDSARAYCCIIMPAEPEKGLLEGDCEWSWYAGPYESYAEGEIALRVHLKFEHGIDYPLERGYKYLQDELDEALRARAAEG